MEKTLWILLPSTVFAVAAAIKSWKVTTLFVKHLRETSNRTERFKETLERIWVRNAQEL